MGSATINTEIEKNKGIITPLLLAAGYYFFLFIIWLIFNRKIKLLKWQYIIIAVLDSQSMFLNIYAFSQINFNYPFIINVSSVFWTVLLTWIFIKRYRYKKFHILGVLICLLGVGVTLFGSLRTLSKETIMSNLKGLICSIIASICYSM